MKFVVALSFLLVFSKSSVAQQQDDTASARQYAMDNFNLGRQSVRSCRYAVGDARAYGACEHEQVWRCHTNPTGCLKAIPNAIEEGATYESFKMLNMAHTGSEIPEIMSIDSSVMKVYHGSLTAYCNFWQVSCNQILAWYANPENAVFLKNLHLTAHK